MTEIEIRELNPLDQRMVDEHIETMDRSTAEDVPGFPVWSKASRIIGMIRTSKAVKTLYRVASLDGRVVGSATAELYQLDNRHLSEIELEVHPDYRRRGVGTALYQALERAVAEDGRDTIHIYVCAGIEGGEPRTGYGHEFAKRHGFKPGLTEVRRRADHEAVNPFDLDELLAAAWAKADGYELVQWIGRAPDDVVDGVAYLDGRLLQDAPTGELDVEPLKVDVDRVRENERNAARTGQLRVNTAVRHKESGRLAGWTDIVANPGDETDGWQGITIVDPDHRGHRIGTILKIENHRLLLRHRPMMRYVHTWNADVNDHMISINEAVGYRPIDAWVAYEKKLTS